MKTRTIPVLLSSIVLIGCTPNRPVAKHNDVITKNGGYATLKRDSKLIFEAIDPKMDGMADPANYTPLFKALKPQVVAIHEQEPPVLMIQTLGGFNHHGLLVVVGSNTTHRPTIGHNWVRKELSPGVFEFGE